MLKIEHGAAKKNCQGITRRTALKAGFCGVDPCKTNFNKYAIR